MVRIKPSLLIESIELFMKEGNCNDTHRQILIDICEDLVNLQSSSQVP